LKRSKRYVSGFDYVLGSEENEMLFAPRIDCLCVLSSVLLQISFRGKTITWLGLVREGGVFAKFRWCLCKGGWCPYSGYRQQTVIRYITLEIASANLIRELAAPERLSTSCIPILVCIESQGCQNILDLKDCLDIHSLPFSIRNSPYTKAEKSRKASWRTVKGSKNQSKRSEDYNTDPHKKFLFLQSVVSALFVFPSFGIALKL